jgi:acyl-CoA reductase-like NAD-dependent aldehyde dehydrogenase
MIHGTGLAQCGSGHRTLTTNIASSPFIYCVTNIIAIVHTRMRIISSLAIYFHLLQIRMVQGVAIDDRGCLVNLNPATGEVISRVPCTQPHEIESKLQASQDAQPAWAGLTVSERIQALKAGLKALAVHKDKLAICITNEMGKPIAQAEEEVEWATGKSDYFDIMEQALQTKQHGSCQVVREPLGVVAVLSPWNFPADEILLLTLPALASGNTVIVKPSEVTPDTGVMVVEALASCLPLNVLQIVQGDGAVGAQLVQSPLVNMIAMTGSSATGQRILAKAATQLKRCVLELGGKDPMVVMPDADIDKAARDAVHYSLYNAGQVCCSIERVYVAESVYKDFQERVVQYAKEYRTGFGMDPDVNLGPLVSTMQRDHVEAHVQDAVDKGASLLYQGELAQAAPPNSSFYPATVVADVTPEMKMYYEETFGPVVAITPFDGSENEGVRLANDTNYGLASCVYTKDMDQAQRMALKIHAGQVGINAYAIENMHVKCPWVGHRDSGYGYHSGEEGVLQFSVPKSIIYTSPP